MGMPTTITQSQARVLASGFLDGLGTKGETFVPDESLAALIMLAAQIIEGAQDNLNSSGQISTGELSDSFKVNDPRMVGKSINLDIQALNYFDFQNKGVRGIGGGSSAAGYSFKTPFPSDGMVKSISEWINRAGLSTVIIKDKKSHGNLETKNKTISQYDSAYAVAMAIKVKGIRGTGYFDKAIKVAQAYSNEVLGKALAVDIIKTLPTKLNGNNNKK